MNDNELNGLTTDMPLESYQTSFSVFSSEPSTYIDPSWFTVMDDGDLLKKLYTLPRSEVRLSDLVSKHFGLNSVSAFNDKTAEHVYLAKSGRLRQLVWGAGLAVHSNEIRQIVGGEEMRWLVKMIGKASHRFAIHESLKDVTNVQIDQYPLLDCKIYSTNPCDVVVKSGLSVLAPFCLSFSADLNRRLSLKLPVSWAQQLVLLSSSIDVETSRKIIECVLLCAEKPKHSVKNQAIEDIQVSGEESSDEW